MALDTNSLADNVDLDDAVASVVPTHGAIVRAEFKAHVGLKLLMSLIYNGKPVPFGALVTSDGSQASSIVADNGQVYLSGMPWRAKCGRNGAKVRTPAARLTTACRRKNRTSC